MTSPQARHEYAFAEDWIVGNLEDIPRQLRLARAVMMLFFALGAWTIYRWTLELYGRSAALLALVLWSLSPDVITYSATVAPDLPAAATGLFASYRFWKWLKEGKNEIPWELGFALALATLSKFSWLFLFVLFPVLTFICDASCKSRKSETSDAADVSDSSLTPGKGRAHRPRFVIERLGKLAIALLCTVVIINLVYGFEGTGRRLADFEFLSKSMGGEHEHGFGTGNRYRETCLGMLPMPIPSEMLQGLDYLKSPFF